MNYTILYAPYAEGVRNSVSREKNPIHKRRVVLLSTAITTIAEIPPG
jgi:hypothetical protein